MRGVDPEHGVVVGGHVLGVGVEPGEVADGLARGGRGAVTEVAQQPMPAQLPVGVEVQGARTVRPVPISDPLPTSGTTLAATGGLPRAPARGADPQSGPQLVRSRFNTARS